MKNLNLVHLNGLRAVEAVGRLGSLPAAAEEMGVSVGAVSQQVIKAEQQLRHKLFDRQPKGMVPTDAGVQILPRLAEAFRLLSGAVASAHHRNDDVLTISVAPVFAARWLVYRLGAFSERHPEISLRLDASTRLVDPATSDVDLCIRVGKGQWPGTQAELLLEQRIFPVCAPALAEPLSSRKELLALPVIIDGHAMFSWDLWLDAAGLSGRTVNTRHVFNEASLCLDSAISGQGVMLAWQIIASHAIRAGQLTVPFGPWVRTGDGHYLVTAEGARKNAKVDAFKAWIREELDRDMAALEEVIGGKVAPPPD